MKVVTEKKEVKKYHNRLISALENHASEKIKALSGHKGASYIKQVSYSKELDIWWDTGDIIRGKSGARYWNAFGIGKPKPKVLTNIICEINYPESGINKRVAANWVKEGSDILLVHSGKIGGGRVGIGKTGFIENYNGIFEETFIEELPEEITIIGSLNDPKLVYQIRNFIYEVDRIKEILVKSKNTTDTLDPLEIIKHSFNDEFVGTKEYKQRGKVVSSSANHGLVVNVLKKLISENGYLVANDQQRDLYIYNKKAEINTVFEIKTSLKSQTIFTAVGQLLVNNARLNPIPKLIFVIPEEPNINLTKTLEKLKIQTLRYTWKKNNPVFQKINNVL